MKFLIVNADDFGAGSGVNRGICQAAVEGILTSTSLMVNMSATGEAARLSRDLPAISVGLHVNLTNEGGPPLAPLDDAVACEREIRSQLRRFEDLLAVAPSHLDSHHNIHRSPSLRPVFVKIAAEQGLPLRENCHVRYFPDFYGQWDGETHPEQISAANLARMLREEVGPGYTELSCHPGYLSADFSSSYGRERELELRALCDPAVREVIESAGIVLVSYRDVPVFQPSEQI